MTSDACCQSLSSSLRIWGLQMTLQIVSYSKTYVCKNAARQITWGMPRQAVTQCWASRTEGFPHWGEAPHGQTGNSTYSHSLTHPYKKLKSQMQFIYKRIPADDQWLESESLIQISGSWAPVQNQQVNKPDSIIQLVWNEIFLFETRQHGNHGKVSK